MSTSTCLLTTVYIMSNKVFVAFFSDEGNKSQVADSYLVKVLRKKDGTTTSRKKRLPGRAPKMPLVCVPCKKRFTRRSKLDQHNRIVHDTYVRYTCSGCQKTFSRRDHIARHVRNGHCTKEFEQTATTATELPANNDDSQLLVELRTYFCN